MWSDKRRARRRLARGRAERRRLAGEPGPRKRTEHGPAWCPLCRCYVADEEGHLAARRHLEARVRLPFPGLDVFLEHESHEAPDGLLGPATLAALAKASHRLEPFGNIERR